MQKENSQYFFRYRCPTRLSFGDWFDHQLPKPKGVSFEYIANRATVIVFDAILPTESVKTHYGLGFDVIIEAKDIEDAQKNTESIIIELISIFSFAEACYVGHPNFVTRYKVPQTGCLLKEATVFILDKNYRSIENSYRPINPERIKSVFALINSITEDNCRYSVKQALHWFWKCLENKDIRDRFLNIWIAVEFLEKHLKGIYGLKSSEVHYPECKSCGKQTNICPNCQKDFGYVANTGFIGLKTLESEAGLEKGLFNRLHRLRSKLVHGGNVVWKKEELENAIKKSHILLSKGIYVIAGTDSKETEKLATKMRDPSLPTIMYFRGEITLNKNITIKDVDQQPFVQGEYRVDYTIDKKTGDLLPLTDVEHKFEGAFESGKMEKGVLIDDRQNTKEVWERNN